MPPWTRILMLAAAAFGLCACAWSALEQDWTTDEPVHLEWSRRLLDTGVTERNSSLHFNSKTPVVVAGVLSRRFARRVLHLQDAEALRFAARLPTVAWLGALLATVFFVARAWLGAEAASIAAALTALDPSVIAHGSLATVDVPFATATLWVLAAGLRFLAIGSGALAGAALGVALLVKFTACLLPAALLLAAALRPWRPGPPPRARALLAGASVAALAAVVVICAGYLFHGVGVALGTVSWQTPLLARLARVFPALPSPLPVDFLTGVDVSLSAERTKDWPVAILGEPRHGRLAYYFGLLWLVKTPLALLLAQVTGAVLVLRSRRLRAQPVLHALAAVLLSLLVYLSFFFRAKLGYRHALMLVPLLCILCAAGLAERVGRRRAWVAAAALALAAAAEQVPYLGNHLAFSNGFVWPKRTAYRVMADSNLDWGQNDEKVQAWMAATGRPASRLNPPHVVPGENVLSVNELVFGHHAWERAFLRPIAHLRHTYLLFDVSEADFARLLEEARKLVPDEADARACAAVPLTPAADGAPLRLSDGGSGLHLLCACAAAPVDFAVTVVAGRAAVGSWGQPRREWDQLGPGQAAWHRLAPGTHALGLARGRDLQAATLVRGGAVEVGTEAR